MNRHHFAAPGNAKHAELLSVLATPLTEPATGQPEVAQSLSRGAAGIALWHLERSHHDVPEARPLLHQWVRAALASPISSAETAGLHAGLPAITFLLHLAEPVLPEYRPAITEFDQHLRRLAHRRVDAALERIRHGLPTRFAEYDLMRGLTGIGHLLLHHQPGSDALARVLDYLVRLTKPITADGETLPGWWVDHAPDQLLPTPGGHSNLGIAHGITGPLAVLAHAARRAITVDGHYDAIDRICAHLDHWQQDSNAGPWWPYWIDHHDYARGRLTNHQPGRPSWCYGTPGIARAQQLAGLATGDTTRQHAAETALLACLNDASQTELVSDMGLCHGWAGLYLTAARTAHDGATPGLAALLPSLAQQLVQHAEATPPPELGLLDSATGVALALHAVTTGVPISGWDQCLLIS